MGEPSQELAEFYEWMMKLRHDCNMTLRPGKSPRDLVAVVDRYLADRGLETMGVGRVGHGGEFGPL